MVILQILKGLVNVFISLIRNLSVHWIDVLSKNESQSQGDIEVSPKHTHMLPVTDRHTPTRSNSDRKLKVGARGEKGLDSKIKWERERERERDRCRETKKWRTNGNDYQPRILGPTDDIEARLAKLRVGHTERQAGQLHWERGGGREEKSKKEREG